MTNSEETTTEAQTKDNHAWKNVMCDCGHHHYHGHWLLRILLVALAFLLVFWLGVKLGEIKGAFGRYGDFRRSGNMMLYRQQTPNMYYQDGDTPPMMQYWQQETPANPSTKTTPSPTPTK